MGKTGGFLVAVRPARLRMGIDGRRRQSAGFSLGFLDKSDQAQQCLMRAGRRQPLAPHAGTVPLPAVTQCRETEYLAGIRPVRLLVTLAGTRRACA